MIYSNHYMIIIHIMYSLTLTMSLYIASYIYSHSPCLTLHIPSLTPTLTPTPCLFISHNTFTYTPNVSLCISLHSHPHSTCLTLHIPSLTPTHTHYVIWGKRYQIAFIHLMNVKTPFLISYINLQPCDYNVLFLWTMGLYCCFCCSSTDSLDC